MIDQYIKRDKLYKQIIPKMDPKWRFEITLLNNYKIICLCQYLNFENV